MIRLFIRILIQVQVEKKNLDMPYKFIFSPKIKLNCKSRTMVAKLATKKALKTFDTLVNRKNFTFYCLLTICINNFFFVL